MKDIMCKNKFLIFNTEEKILIFLKQQNKKTNYFVPTIYTEGNNIDNPISFKILEILNLNFENVQLVNEFHDEYFSFKIIDDELTRKKVIREKKYYAVYHKFTQEEYNEIYTICLSQNIISYMVSLEELEYIMNLKRKRVADMDLYIGHTAKMLQKKLKYEEY